VKHGCTGATRSRPTKRLQRLEHHASDPTPLDLSAELALARTLLEEWLAREGTDPEDGMKLVEKVTQIVERIEGIDAKNHITYPQLKRFLFAVAQILEFYVEDKAILSKIKEALLGVRVGY
jgi:hypothetical protein